MATDMDMVFTGAGTMDMAIMAVAFTVHALALVSQLAHVTTLYGLLLIGVGDLDTAFGSEDTGDKLTGLMEN